MLRPEWAGGQNLKILNFGTRVFLKFYIFFEKFKCNFLYATCSVFSSWLTEKSRFLKIHLQSADIDSLRVDFFSRFSVLARLRKLKKCRPRKKKTPKIEFPDVFLTVVDIFSVLISVLTILARLRKFKNCRPRKKNTSKICQIEISHLKFHNTKQFYQIQWTFKISRFLRFLSIYNAKV